VTGVTRPCAVGHLSISSEHQEASKHGGESDHNETPRPHVGEDNMGSYPNEVRQQIAADKSYEETKQDNQPSSDPYRSGWTLIHATEGYLERRRRGGYVCRRSVTGVTRPCATIPPAWRLVSGSKHWASPTMRCTAA
jgi:hypothetical protein